MTYASVISENIIGFKEAARVARLLLQYDLPTFVSFDKQKVFDVLKMDKKRERQEISYVMLEKIGKGVIKSIQLEKLFQIIETL
jgi:3-dehydroquinate synthase